MMQAMARATRYWRMAAISVSTLCLVASAGWAKPSGWSRAIKPATGPAESIGGYSAGCVRGAKAMPSKGKGFQLMQPSRKRYFGHPVLIDYLQRVAKKIEAAKAGPIMIADLGQPMGGPSNSGHASHQSGLDVDIWFWHPKAAEKRSLRLKERESLRARSIVDRKNKVVNHHWNDNISTILRIAASEPEVSKIFVNPLIKQRLCESKDKDRVYLHKVRPWYGHADHMHVRLVCPADSPGCVDQEPLPEGDGCEELSWWLDDEAQAARKAAQASYQGKVGALPTLPEPCEEMMATTSN